MKKSKQALLLLAVLVIGGILVFAFFPKWLAPMKAVVEFDHSLHTASGFDDVGLHYDKEETITFMGIVASEADLRELTRRMKAWQASDKRVAGMKVLMKVTVSAPSREQSHSSAVPPQK